MKHRHSNPKEPLTVHEIPTRPLRNFVLDLFHFDGKGYMVTINYYSRYFEVDSLPDTSSSTVINKLKVHFATHEICDKFMSDNGGQYASEFAADFARQ